MTARRRLARWIEGTADVAPLIPLRVSLGIIAIIHLAPFAADAASGVTWSDRFNVPHADWYPAVGGTAYTVLLAGALLAAAAMAVGACTRLSSAATAGFVVWNLFLTRTNFHHNRAYLAALLVGAALLPLGGRWSIDALARRRRGAEPRSLVSPSWPWLLMRFEASVVYTASGVSKLLDGDWWSGLVLRLRVEEHSALAVSRGVPRWVIDALSDPVVMGWLAKVIVLTEMFIGLGLLFRRTRTAAIWVAIPFHIAIEATASVQVFSILGIAALVVWATPGSGDRTLLLDTSVPAARRLGQIVHRLDWLSRFRLAAAPPDGPRVVLIDRARPDGTRPIRTGRAAVLAVAARLPLTFWPAAPFAAAATRRSRPQGGDHPAQPLDRVEGDRVEDDLHL